MTSEINKQIAELLLKQTYAERMWFANEYHTWLSSIYEATDGPPNVQELADSLQDFAEAVSENSE